MAACLLITLPLEFVFGARVYRRFKLMALALLPVVLIFSIWDVVGIVREHWDYNPAYVTGVQLVFAMPLEELVFFIVIPICGLLTYEAVGQVLPAAVGWRASATRRSGGPPMPEYTVLTVIAVLATVALELFVLPYRHLRAPRSTG